MAAEEVERPPSGR